MRPAILLGLALTCGGCTVLHYNDGQVQAWALVAGVGHVEVPLAATPVPGAPLGCEVVRAESQGFSVGFAQFLADAAAVVGAWFTAGGG